MKKIIIGLALVAVLMSGCASIERGLKDMQSDLDGGLKRTLTVYNANGDVLKTYKGMIDLAPTEGGYVKFDFNGKRILYYNCYVEVIED